MNLKNEGGGSVALLETQSRTNPVEDLGGEKKELQGIMSIWRIGVPPASKEKRRGRAAEKRRHLYN